MSKNEVLVSVIIPLYNAEKYIKQTIESVLDQTYSHWEVLVIDDCSTDNSREIVKNIDDDRVQLIELEHNFGGPARPRNIGIQKAKGEYIAFLDADDIWYKDKLEICMNDFNNEVDLIFHDFAIIGQPGKFIRGKLLESPVVVDLLVNHNPICNSSVVVRKNLLKKVGGIDESLEMIASEDHNTWLKIANITEKFHYIPKVLGGYLVNEESISHKDMTSNIEKASAAFINCLNKNQKKNFLLSIKYSQARYHYRKGNFSLARKSLLFTINNGNIILQLKALWMLFVIFLAKF